LFAFLFVQIRVDTDEHDERESESEYRQHEYLSTAHEFIPSMSRIASSTHATHAGIGGRFLGRHAGAVSGGSGSAAIMSFNPKMGVTGVIVGCILAGGVGYILAGG
jgi:hypothetical protein